MRGKISTVDRFLRLFSVRGSRGQAALESMVVLAGLFAFVAVIYGASLPLQAEAQAQADRLDQQAAFESVRFALRLAAGLGPGFSLAGSFFLSPQCDGFLGFGFVFLEGPVVQRHFSLAVCRARPAGRVVRRAPLCRSAHDWRGFGGGLISALGHTPA